MTSIIERQITPSILTALEDTPVVLLNGPRQAGKSTLIKDIAQTRHPANYITFDEEQMLLLARADPENFLTGYQGPLMLDEVQRVPSIFLAIKLLVDRQRTPGQFLLTGSANVLLLPQIADSLAGRMEIIPLWPLSQTEVNHSQFNFVDFIFSDKQLTCNSLPNHNKLWEKILLGGYPEILSRKNEARRRAWFDSYVTSILLRDTRELANIEGISELPNLLNIIATRATGLLNFSELSRSAKLPQTTLKRYVTLLQTTFLLSLLKPWSNNINKRFVKSPKVMLNDTGLLAHLLGITAESLQTQPNARGMLLENFVFTELTKHNSWSQTLANIFHCRTHTGSEIDLLLESADKRLIGIEVKAAKSVNPQDFSGLKMLQTEYPKQFHRGIVLYTGEKYIPYGKQLAALPIHYLFDTQQSPQ